MDSFVASSLAALVGIVVLALGLAGVPENTGVTLVVGGALVLVPTIASLISCGRRRDPHSIR